MYVQALYTLEKNLAIVLVYLAVDGVVAIINVEGVSNASLCEYSTRKKSLPFQEEFSVFLPASYGATTFFQTTERYTLLSATEHVKILIRRRIE